MRAVENFFHIVNERASFALHARLFESPRLIVSLKSAEKYKAAWRSRSCHVKIKKKYIVFGKRFSYFQSRDFVAFCSLCVKLGKNHDNFKDN